MKRDPKTHLAIIPKEVLDIWELKFGKREKPPYYAKCNMCGIAAGQHYGTDCPDEYVKKLVQQNEKLLEVCKLFKKRLLTHGEWDDGCFYYAGNSAPELEEPLNIAKAAIALAERS